MKRLIILLTLTTIFFNANSQTFKHNFLGSDFMLYKGTLLKLKDDKILLLSFAFYSDLKYCQSDLNTVIYPDTAGITFHSSSTEKYKFITVKDSLANRIFIVQDIVDKSGGSCNTNTTFSFPDKPIFILKDTATQQLIYYKYDKEYENNFPFNTSPIDFSTLEKTFCSKIFRKVDDFTEDVKLSSPMYTAYKIASMIIYKDISKTKTSYYLRLNTKGSTVTVNGTGATILFTDGTKWSKPDKIDVKAGSNGFDYSAFITLTQADLVTLTTKAIKKYRLYIYDEEVNQSDADKFKIYVKCIREAK